MKTARKNKVKFLKNQKGQGMVEYILLLVVVISIVMIFKGRIKTKFDEVMGRTESGMSDVISPN